MENTTAKDGGSTIINTEELSNSTAQKTLVITLYRDSGMTTPAIERFLKTFDLQISHGKISSWLTEDHDIFHAEKEDIIGAGFAASPYQQMDDTGSRVNGKNHYTHVLCNDFFTAYFTRPGKDRLTLLELLCRDQLMFLFNQDALVIMADFGLAKKWLTHIEPMLQTKPLARAEMANLVRTLFPNPKSTAPIVVFYWSQQHWLGINNQRTTFNIL